MTHTITREFLRTNGACYYDEPGGEDKVNALVPPNGLAPLQVARLAIPAQDRVWVLTRRGALPDSALWEWSARTVERALARVATPDHRSVAVVLLLRRLARGEDVSQSDLTAAWAEARAADRAAAWAEDWAAAWEADWVADWAAAWTADRAAAWAEDWAAEREQQIADIISILEAQP